MADKYKKYPCYVRGVLRLIDAMELGNGSMYFPYGQGWDGIRQHIITIADETENEKDFDNACKKVFAEAVAKKMKPETDPVFDWSNGLTGTTEMCGDWSVTSPLSPPGEWQPLTKKKPFWKKNFFLK